MINKIILSAGKFSWKQFSDIINSVANKLEISIDVLDIKKIQASYEYVKKLSLDPSRTVYGINTGFGALANKKIDLKDLSKLQINLIRSHCTGVGEPFSAEITRGIMILRAYCLIQGHSGVKLETIELILRLIEKNILPVIPSQGSVGASGDLAPLAHLALALVGEGDVIYEGKILNSKWVLEKEGLKPLVLEAKEGLALINGTAVMTALGMIATIHAENLMNAADIISALTLDSIHGSIKPFSELISKVKPHPGQLLVAKNLNEILKGSEILTSHPHCQKVQDPYSLRCIPQVHGACRQTLVHSQEVLSIEMHSVTDNPLIFVESDTVISGGNFHGEAIAMVMDYLAIGVSEIASISERRIEKMMNPSFSELPAFLIQDSGLNSGLMIAQVTAAALASENKYLCHPASVDSIPTSTDKEDHVSMGVTSGRKLQQVIANTYNVLAIELLCATQALEFSRPLKTSPTLEKVHALIRTHVQPITEDRVFSKDIAVIRELIQRGEITSIFSAYQP